MSSISTLVEFLEKSDIRVQAFDLGRRITKLPRRQLLSFEQRGTAYPYPFLQHAWLGFLLSDQREGALPLIWFLKFPLDSEGKLVSATRDDFLLRIIKSVGEKLELGSVDPGVDALKETPYAFKPEDERMACFHARASRILQAAPSSYYATARDYFAGKASIDDWQTLGLQGIADLCSRLDQHDNALNLSQIMPVLPAVPLEMLCCCLENEAIKQPLTEAITSRAKKLLDEFASPALVAALLRGISHSKAPEIRQQLIDDLLTSTIATDPEILAAIASRCWQDLKDPARLQRYLEQLAANSAGCDYFNRVLLDLLLIPGMPPRIMAQFRNPERSETLASAIGEFLKLGS